MFPQGHSVTASQLDQLRLIRAEVTLVSALSDEPDWLHALWRVTGKGRAHLLGHGAAKSPGDLLSLQTRLKLQLRTTVWLQDGHPGDSEPELIWTKHKSY